MRSNPRSNSKSRRAGVRRRGIGAVAGFLSLALLLALCTAIVFGGGWGTSMALASDDGPPTSRIVDGRLAPAGYESVGTLVSRYSPRVEKWGFDQDWGFCTGTLIAPDLVLTAAHCLRGRKAGRTWFVLGKQRLSADRRGIRVAFRRFFSHPRYSPRPNRWDIAVGRLSSPIYSVTPMPFGQPSDPPLRNGDHVATAGWGVRSSRGGTMSDRLRLSHGWLTLSHSDCAKLGWTAREGEVCVYAANRSGSPCFGDSGGPLVLLGDAIDAVSQPPLRVVGVTSYYYGHSARLRRCGSWKLDVYQSVGPGTSMNGWVRDFLF